VRIAPAWLSSRKGDLEFIEVIMVLVVIVVLLVIGLVIYYNITAEDIGETGKRISDTQASVLVNVIDSMSETQCSIRSAPKDCIDVVKLNAFNKTAGDPVTKSVYIDLFGFKVVRFEQIYPPVSGIASADCKVPGGYKFPPECGNWTVYSNVKPNYKGKDILKTPVSLFNPLDNTYSVGVLFVEVYS
jgi:hypothetical protein